MKPGSITPAPRKRPNGFYWVQVDKGLKWEPAQFKDGQWNILDDFAGRLNTVGGTGSVSPDYFVYKVGQRIRRTRKKLNQ